MIRNTCWLGSAAAPPTTGWSWVDRRLLREPGDQRSREAVLLYMVLAAVADRPGLSFYSDPTLTSRWHLSQPVPDKAREELRAPPI